MKLLLVVLAATALCVADGSLFGDRVHDLKTRGDLSAILKESGGPQLVYIYDSLDVNCHKKAPVISATGEALDGFVPVVAMDTRQAAFQWVLNAWGVQVIPSVGILHGGASPPTSANAAAASKLVASHLNRYVGGGAKPVELFPHTKPITVESLKKSALAALPDKGIERVSTVVGFNKVTKSVWGTPSVVGIPSELGVVVLFTDKPKTSALYKSLAVKYSGMLRFVEVLVKGASSPVAKHDVFAGADTTPFPALFVVTSNEDGSLVSSRYPVDNALTVEAISSHIDDVAGLTAEQFDNHGQKKNALTINAHQRRSGIFSGVIEVNSKADWNEFAVRNAGISKVGGGPIRIVFTNDVKGLRTSLLTIVASTSTSVPKTIFLVDSAAQSDILKHFGGMDDASNYVVDIIPSLQSDAVVYKYGVHPSSMGTESYLEKPAMKRNLEVLSWAEVPEFKSA